MSDVYNGNAAQELRRACESGDAERARALINTGTVDPNQVFSDSSTLLFAAAQYGRLEVVQVLLNHGANVNLGKTSTGQTPLYIAVQNEQSEVAQALLDFGANPNQETSDTGDTPLVVACEIGNLPIVRLLLQHQPNAADVTKVRVKDGCPALVAAAMNGRTEIVQQLLATPGIQVNQTNLNNETALFHASFRWWTQIATDLLKAKADPNIANRDKGTSPLMNASQGGFYDIVLPLLRHGADPNQEKPNTGSVSLFMAALFGNVDVVQYLAYAGANVNHVRQIDTGTSLFIAAEQGHAEIVKVLLAAGANPNLIRTRPVRDKVEIMSPLEVATLMGQIAVVRALLATGEMTSHAQIVRNAITIAKVKAENPSTPGFETYKAIAELLTSTWQTPITLRPVFSHSPGACSVPFELTFSCPTPGAEIYYTLDGATPSKENGQLFQTPIVIDGTRSPAVVVQAVAIGSGMEPSFVVKAIYFPQGQPNSIETGSEAWAKVIAPVHHTETAHMFRTEADAHAIRACMSRMTALDTTVCRSDGDAVTVTPDSTAPERPEVCHKFSHDGIIYTRKRWLGRGGYGEVWYYEHSSGKRFAVKFIPYAGGTGSEAARSRERIQREISVLEKLKHPNIVRHEKTIMTRFYVCMGMEYLPQSLHRVIEESGPVPMPKLKQYARQILSALEYLHDHNIVHQDVKPANVLLDENDNAKLVDFGVAVPRGAYMHRIYGTLAFLPPEAPATPRNETDVWSFGLTILVLLLGGLPRYYARVIDLDTENTALKERILTANYSALTEGCGVPIPSDLESFLRKCLLGSSEWDQRARCSDLLQHPFIPAELEGA